jgi:LacI family transcriptional regulator
MRDVAALAGVGIKTVSRVVNGEPGVSSALVSRVTEAALTLNFQPDMTAGNLRRTGHRSLTIGLLLASVDNPFSASIHRAVEDVAETRGVAVFSASTDEHHGREKALAAAFTARRVDGLIITPTGVDQRYLIPEIDTGTPVVMIDRAPVGIETDHVVVDNCDGAETATAHLIGHGHRRIAFLGDLDGIATVTQRCEGYRRAMAAVGARLDPSLIVTDLHSEAIAFKVAVGLLTMPNAPTAIFASQNLITIGVVRALRVLGLNHRVALVGFDDFLLADLLDPAVTVIAQDPVAIGRAAAERVFARLTHGTLPPAQIVIPTRLILRRSGEIPPSQELT